MKSWLWTFVAALAVLGIRAEAAVADAPPPPVAASQDASAVTQDTGCAGMSLVDGCPCDPVWRVRADLLCMRISKPNDAVLVTDYTPYGDVLLNASEFKFNYECGPEIAIERQINDDWSIEGRFFRIDGWNASRGPVLGVSSEVQYATPMDILPTTSPYYPQATNVAGSYRSELSDVEINARWQINDFWSVLLGFRASYSSGHQRTPRSSTGSFITTTTRKARR